MRWVMGFQFSQLSLSALSPKFPRWLLRCHHGCVFFQEIFILLSYWRDRNNPLKDKYFPHNPPKILPKSFFFLHPLCTFWRISIYGCDVTDWSRDKEQVSSARGVVWLVQCPVLSSPSASASAAPIIVCNLRIWSCWLLVCWTWAQPRAPSV